MLRLAQAAERRGAVVEELLNHNAEVLRSSPDPFHRRSSDRAAQNSWETEPWRPTCIYGAAHQGSRVCRARKKEFPTWLVYYSHL
jgi:hypothetical protein